MLLIQVVAVFQCDEELRTICACTWEYQRALSAAAAVTRSCVCHRKQEGPVVLELKVFIFKLKTTSETPVLQAIGKLHCQRTRFLHQCHRGW